jgi:hypothetical protein
MAAFEDEEIESIRDICLLSTHSSVMSDLQAKLDLLNEAQAEGCRADIAAWNKVRYGTTKIDGGVKGTNFDIERDRLYITNRMRLRLTFEAVVGYAGADDFASITLGLPGWSGGSSKDEFSGC